MRYDNIEIGTADFDTLIESAEGNGLSVEPVPVYFERLPDREDWKKANVAVGESGTVKCYYVDPESAEGLPRWVRGCNSIGSPHKTIVKMYPEIVRLTEVESLTPTELFERYDVTEVGFLKIDAEGMDGDILERYLDAELPMPEKLQFEWNALSDDEQMFTVSNKLKSHYKSVQKRGSNVICW